MGKKNNTPKVHRPSSYSDYKELDRQLRSRRLMSVDAVKQHLIHNIPLGDRDPSNAGATDMAACMGGGTLSTGPLSKVAWSFDSTDTLPTPVTDKDGKPLGRGYVKWGPKDNLPSEIYAYAKALPYTASPLKYLADLATGLGPRLMYRFPDGEMVEYRDAGERLRERVEQLEAEEQEQRQAEGDPSLLINILGDKGGREESPKLQRARQALKDWERTWEGEDIADNPEETDPAMRSTTHRPGAREFLEENDLDLHMSQCMQDDVMFDMYFPTVGLERGRRGAWDPKIVRVSLLPIISGVRYEAMNELRYIEHLYYSDSWRTKGMNGATIVNAADKKVTMYPVAMPQNRLSEMRYLVQSNQRTRIKERPTWAVWPVYYGNKPYYQQPAWWSIFLAKFYDFSATIAYDKSKARENRTSWGKIMYISLDYLDQVFADEGYQGNPDAQQKFIEELEQQMENFLQHRENNGKMMRQWMWTGPDGKEHKNVEIVDVAETTKDAITAGKEELELATSPIFLALGVDPRLVGVPMVSASNGGTALREMALLKQQQLNVKQRLYERFLNSIIQFNGWDTHAIFRVKQITLSTLDRSSTGQVETISGEGA